MPMQGTWNVLAALCSMAGWRLPASELRSYPGFRKVVAWTTVARLPCARKGQTILALDVDDKTSSLTACLARLQLFIWITAD